MSKLFAYDNPVWVFMGKVADAMLLTLFWFIFSIPIITIGASTSALYYTTLKLCENREGYLFKTFLKGFKESFRQSTIIWMILGIIGGILAFSIYQYQKVGSQVALTFLWALMIFAFLYLLIFTLIFALNGRLSTDIPNLFMMTFMISIKHFSWAFFMTVILACSIAASIFIFWPLLFIIPGAVSYINSFILVKFIFPKYGWNLKDEEEDSDSELSTDDESLTADEAEVKDPAVKKDELKETEAND